MKKSKTDFTKEMLPHNRFELFKDIFRINFSILFKIGMVLLLSCIPFLIFEFIYDQQIMELISEYNNGNINEAVFSRSCLNYEFYKSIFNIVSFAILSISLSGIAEVIKRLCYNEPVFFKEDFNKGIKENIKSFIITGLVIGILYSLTCYMRTIIGNEFLSYIPKGIFLFIVLPIVYYELTLSTIYINPYKTNLKNAFILFLSTVPESLLFGLIFGSITFLFNISIIFIKYMILLFIIVMVIPLILVAWTLFAYSIFDKYINKDNYRKIYKKGLVGENENE